MVEVPFHARLVLRLHGHDGVVVIRAVGNAPKSVNAVQLMKDVQCPGVGVITKTPIFVLKFGHYRGVFAHLDNVGASQRQDSSNAPFFPDGVDFRTWPLSSNGWLVFRRVECAIEQFRLKLEVYLVIDGGCEVG